MRKRGDELPETSRTFVTPVMVGHSAEEQLTSKAYYEVRALKLMGQFSPKKLLIAASANPENKSDPTQLSRLFAGVLAYVATGLYVSLDKPRMVLRSKLSLLMHSVLTVWNSIVSTALTSTR